MFAVIDIWTTTNWDDNIVGAAAVIVALGVIWQKLLKPMRQAWQRVSTVMTLVEHELKPNSGATLRDAIDRIEQRLSIVEQQRDPKSRTRHTDPEVGQ